MTNQEAINYLKQIYPQGGCRHLDEQRMTAIGMAIDAIAEKEKKRIEKARNGAKSGDKEQAE